MGSEEDPSVDEWMWSGEMLPNMYYDEISTKEMYPQSSVGCDLLKRKEWLPNGNGNKAKFRRFEKRESWDKSSRRIVTQRPNTCSARSLRSDRVRVKAQSLRSDRTPIPPGRYVATELEPKFGRYVATELFRNVDTTSVHAFSSTLRCYLLNTVANPSHIPRHF
ncbi:hypothetical protein DY000_02039623 [Brassica cretica]|uniref:Uncharacterized protein n=1 Tax=Brassica cretica TaxID=69181 RepID=A0ABQ7BJE1_BRACR|nr:hypothetical protein DY000_02039623 [Brassica cretica]